MIELKADCHDINSLLALSGYLKNDLQIISIHPLDGIELNLKINNLISAKIKKLIPPLSCFVRVKNLNDQFIQLQVHKISTVNKFIPNLLLRIIAKIFLTIFCKTQPLPPKLATYITITPDATLAISQALLSLNPSLPLLRIKQIIVQTNTIAVKLELEQKPLLQ